MIKAFLFRNPFPSRFWIVVLLTCFVYGVTLTAPFVYDDLVNISANSSLHQLDRIDLIWSKNQTRFVPYLSFAVDYRIFGDMVLRFHLTNLMLHLLAAFLVYKLSQLLLSLPRFREAGIFGGENIVLLFTALIFALHPLQTQAVTFVVQRITVFVAVFYLAAVYFYIRFRLSSCRSFYGLSLVAAVFQRRIKFYPHPRCDPGTPLISAAVWSDLGCWRGSLRLFSG